jgi:hypothetical protein
MLTNKTQINMGGKMKIIKQLKDLTNQLAYGGVGG